MNNELTFIGVTLLSVSIAATCFAQADSTAAPSGERTPAAANDQQQLWCEYPGGEGPGAGKHIVLIAGDDEYRSEESMPMLAKILSVHHGFRCTVLFPIDPADNTIKPDFQENIPGMHLIDSADLLILGLRFRQLPDDDMKHFVDYVDAGKPIIGFRTSTHAFNYKDDARHSLYANYSYNSRDWPGGFGQQVLGDTWIDHHGNHGAESTRGIVNHSQKSNPILRGVTDVWGPTDVYGIRNLPATANVLLYAQVLDGMQPDSKPVTGEKNEPMMPLAWTKDFVSKSGKEARIFATTMGASTDFQNEGLRRLIVNAAYWALGMEDKIPPAANVDFVGKYQPTNFGFGTYTKGIKPAAYNLPGK
jgi:hypothetical protein